LPESFSSPTRRLILLGVMVAAGALLWSVVQRRDTAQPVSAGGNFNVCAKAKGEAARACYSREVGRELAVVGATATEITFAAPSGTGTVTFASAEAQEPLLCDLHARVGVTDEQVPSWLGWAEPLAQTAPVS
jgi:2-keto-3-deoxy-6-phosphogluconate aldolase